ncbi:MAG TPA: hypothetical protein VF139_06750 [Candidatus Polarisedimenticolaceae bacterium]
MAVYDRSYAPYAGAWTAPASRFRVLARYALSELFEGRLTTIVFTAAFAMPLGGAAFIYVRTNAKLLAQIGASGGQLSAIDTTFFLGLMSWQSFLFGGLLTLLCGPQLISRDLANGALPLILSRPVTKTQYVVGKLAVLFGLLSVITWIPGLLLFALQASLGEDGWFAAHARIPFAIVAGCGLWIAVLSLLALAASALAGRKVTAQAMLVGAVLGGAWAGNLVNAVFDTAWGHLLNVPELMRALLEGLYGVPLEAPLPHAAPWIAIPALCGLCLLVLSRRLKAKEVVR